MVSLPIILLILISTDPPRTIPREGTTSANVQSSEVKITEDEKNYRSSHSKVNDLIATDFRFPENPPKVEATKEKTSRKKLAPDQKEANSKTPVPLYSLVKNECGEGYTLDENGICQKTITARNGKTFDSERRRKRFVSDHELTIEKSKNRNSNITKKLKEDGSVIKNSFGKPRIKCGELYPGAVSDDAGGCSKP